MLKKNKQTTKFKQCKLSWLFHRNFRLNHLWFPAVQGYRTEQDGKPHNLCGTDHLVGWNIIQTPYVGCKENKNKQKGNLLLLHFPLYYQSYVRREEDKKEYRVIKTLVFAALGLWDSWLKRS
jgi:hypothetical protein